MAALKTWPMPLAPVASCSFGAMENDDYDQFYKVVLVGDATVGKTHLLSRYVKSRLPKAEKSDEIRWKTRETP